MSNKETFEKFKKWGGIHLLVFVSFGLITAFFFSPAFFGNKTLSQSDILGHRGASKEIKDHREQYGEEPLWTNSMFGGMPAYQISTKHKSNLLDSVNGIVRSVFPHPFANLFIAFCCFYGLMLILKIPPLTGALGAIGFGLSSYNIQLYEAGHNSKMAALAYMPMVLGGLLMVLRDQKKLLGLGVFALFLALELTANHLQMTYYLAITIALILVGYVLYAIKKNELPNALKSFGFLAVGGLIALACNASNLWTTYEYKKETIRGKSELTAVNQSEDSSDGLDPSYITAWSYQKAETFNLLIPNFKGGGSGAISGNKTAMKQVNKRLKKSIGALDKYFGGQPFTSGPSYIGAALIFLALIGAILYQGWLKWPLIAAMTLAIFLSWGKFFMGFTGFFIDNMPLYSNFRAPAMILVVVQLSIPILAVLGIKEAWQNRESTTVRNKFYVGSGVMLALLLFFLAFPKGGNSFFKPMDPLADARQITVEKAVKGNATVVLDGDELNCYVTAISPKEAAREIYTALVTDSLMSAKWNFAHHGNKVKANAKATDYKTGDFLVSGAVEGDLIQVTEKEELTFQLEKNNWRKKDLKKFLSNLESARIAIFKSDVQRSFGFVLVGFIFLALLFHSKLEQSLIAAMLLALVFVDLWGADGRYLGKENYAPKGLYTEVFDPSPADISIEQANNGGRVLNLAVSTFNDASTSYMHQSVGGYSAVKLRRYQEFYERELFNDFEQVRRGFSDGSVDLALQNAHGLNMLNTGAVIYNPSAPAYLNPNAYGKLWFADSVIVAKSADEELAFTKQQSRKGAVVVSEMENGNISQQSYQLDSMSKASLSEYRANYLKYDVSSKHKSCLVFSEIFYKKGWVAKIDGEVAEIARANYLLRALEVPAGKHSIEFEFAPKSYIMGSRVSLAGSFIVILLLAGGIWKSRKDKGEKEAVE